MTSSFFYNSRTSSNNSSRSCFNNCYNRRTSSNYNSIRTCSALDSLRRFSLLREGGRKTFRIKGGNSALPEAMAQALGPGSAAKERGKPVLSPFKMKLMSRRMFSVVRPKFHHTCRRQFGKIWKQVLIQMRDYVTQTPIFGIHSDRWCCCCC